MSVSDFILLVTVFATGGLLFGIDAMGQKLGKRYYIYGGVGVVAITALAFDAYDLVTDHGQRWQITIFLGSTLVAFGWIVTNEIAIRNSRKQHTISLITDYLFTEPSLTDRATIRKVLPRYTVKLNPSILNYDEETNALAIAIDRQLNFYEFFAIGIEAGDLDGLMAQKMLGIILVGFITQVDDYIQHWQKKDPLIWFYVYALYNEWKK